MSKTEICNDKFPSSSIAEFKNAINEQYVIEFFIGNFL